MNYTGIQVQHFSLSGKRNPVSPKRNGVIYLCSGHLKFVDQLAAGFSIQYQFQYISTITQTAHIHSYGLFSGHYVERTAHHSSTIQILQLCSGAVIGGG